MTVKVSDWKPINRGALLGFCTVTMPSGMILREVSIFQSDTSLWASPPSKPMIDKDGYVVTDNAGKRRYVTIIEFVSKEVRDRWSMAVIDALRAAYPGALR